MAKAFETGFNESVAAQAQFAVAVPGNVVILPGSFFTNGTFGLQLSGTPGKTYILQGSTNLFSWIPVSTNMPASSPFLLIDPTAANFRYRFYRAEQLP
jgi:hypothetical protein